MASRERVASRNRGLPRTGSSESASSSDASSWSRSRSRRAGSSRPARGVRTTPRASVRRRPAGRPGHPGVRRSCRTPSRLDPHLDASLDLSADSDEHLPDVGRRGLEPFRQFRRRLAVSITAEHHLPTRRGELVQAGADRLDGDRLRPLLEIGQSADQEFRQFGTKDPPTPGGFADLVADEVQRDAANSSGRSPETRRSRPSRDRLRETLLGPGRRPSRGPPPATSRTPGPGGDARSPGSRTRDGFDLRCGTCREMVASGSGRDEEFRAHSRIGGQAARSDLELTEPESSLSRAGFPATIQNDERHRGEISAAVRAWRSNAAESRNPARAPPSSSPRRLD